MSQAQHIIFRQLKMLFLCSFPFIHCTISDYIVFTIQTKTCILIIKDPHAFAASLLFSGLFVEKLHLELAGAETPGLPCRFPLNL